MHRRYFTPYRLILSGLTILAIISIVEAFFGWLSFTPLDLILSLAVLLFSCQTVNAFCALFTKASPAPESAFITALILFFILSPLQSAGDALFFIIAGALAMLSKYVFAFGKAHIFNPAAFAALLLTLAGSGLVTWWVATPVLLPGVLIIGFFVVRKARRWDVFLSFAATAFLITMVGDVLFHSPLLTDAFSILAATPLFYLGMLMLIDPQTMPTSHKQQILYAILVGFLFAIAILLSVSDLRIGEFSLATIFSFSTALLVGNLYGFLVERPKRKRYTLSLLSVTQLAKEVFEYSFAANSPFMFRSGQYAEWSLPHKSPDSRGIRRYFTISSSPGEHVLRFTASMPVESSTFKDALRALKKGKEMLVTKSLGEFTLSKDPTKKILGIAGNMGIIPFMSMFRDLAYRHERRDIMLIYSATSPLDFIFQKEIDAFKDSIGLRVLYLPMDFPELSGWPGPSGYITKELIEKEIRDYRKREWYLAGPEELAKGYVLFAKKLGIPRSSIKVEYV